MADPWAPPPPPRPRRRWPRRLAWILGGLFLFLVLTYFVVTSFTFLDSFILPRVNSSLNGTVTLGDASISPFSRVRLHELKVAAGTFEEPLLKAREIRARYSLWQILKGNLQVAEVVLDSPTVNYIEYEDGTSNLDRLLKPTAPQQQPPPPEAPAGPSEPLRVDVGRVVLTNALVRRTRHLPGGAQEVAELAGVNIVLANVGNGKAGTLDLRTDLKLDAPAASTNAARDVLQGRLAGAFQFALTTELQPQSVSGRAVLEVSQTPDALRDLAGLAAALECDLTPTELRQLALTFSKGGSKLGQVTASGPLDLAKLEGAIKLDIASIDRQVLNLAGATAGLDFGPTTLNSSHQIVLTNGGLAISAAGRIDVSQLSVTQQGLTTKPLDLQVNYDVAVDQADSSAVVQSFTITGTQAQQPLLLGRLAQPMKLSFGNASNAVESSAFHLTVTNLNVADWRAFVGDYAGRLNLTLDVQAREAGRALTWDLQSSLTEIAARFGSNELRNADVRLLVRGGLEGFRQVHLEECGLQLSHQHQPALALKANGTYDVETQAAAMGAEVEATLPALIGLWPVAGLSVANGKLNLNAKLLQEAPAAPVGRGNPATPAQTVTARLVLSPLSGEYNGTRFDRFETEVDLEAALRDQQVTLRKLAGALRQAGQAAGRFDASGRCTLTNLAGELALNLTAVNQHLLQPLAAPALGDKSLASLALDLNTTATYQPAGESTLQTKLRVADLLIADPARKLPGVPLGAELTLAAGWQGDVATLRQCAATLRQGEQTGGRLEASGRYDMKQQAGEAAVKLADLNHHALRPLLASALGERTLETVSINVDATARYDAKADSSVAGDFRLANLLVRDPSRQLPATPLGLDFRLEAGLRGEQAVLQRFSGQLKAADAPGGEFNLRGKYDLKQQTAAVAFKLIDVNQNLLRPFAASALGDRRLTSISVSADAEAAYGPAGTASVQGEFNVANLVIADAEGRTPPAPLGVGLRLNGGFTNQVLSLEKLLLKLSPTERARNELTVTGTVDLTRTNLVAGNLNLNAPSLDLTPYYDLFAAPPSTNALAGTSPATNAPGPIPTSAPTPPATTNAEPAPVSLPFHQFTVALTIGQFYLREIAIADWQAGVKLDRSQVNLKPFQLALNSAPLNVTADLDLGVPGYRYDVAFAADRIPVEPIANTFVPEQRGKFKGSLLTQAQLKGAGSTGPNLRQHLAGQLSFALTNTTLQVDSGYVTYLLAPIAAALRTPELMKSPLNSVGATAQIGAGKVQFTRLDLQSETFKAETRGDITLANDLLASPVERWPVNFYLRRTLAQRLGASGRNSGADGEYSKLPDFVRVAGTVGDPKVELDMAALVKSGMGKALERLTGGADSPGGTGVLNPFKKPSP